MACRTQKHNFFMASVRFVLDKFITSVLGKNDFYLTFKSKTSAVIYSDFYYNSTAKHANDNMTYLL